MAYKDRQVQREYQRKWVAARRAKYIAEFGSKCEACGSTEGFEFDHKDQTQKEDHRIWAWSEARIKAELEKCQLLCRVCHQDKSIAESNYPERKHGTNTMYTNGRCRCGDCRKAHAEVNRKYF